MEEVEKIKSPNLQWLLLAYSGNRRWGVRGYRSNRRALDHRQLRNRAGITSALALLGQSPLIVNSSDLVERDAMVLALPAPTQKFILLALQAQPRVEAPIVVNSTCISEKGTQRKKRTRSALSPLSVAVRRASRLIPEMWRPIQENCGATRKDRRAASALMVLSHRALMLEKTVELFPAVISGWVQK
jgi:hypothetical protein